MNGNEPEWLEAYEKRQNQQYKNLKKDIITNTNRINKLETRVNILYTSLAFLYIIIQIVSPVIVEIVRNVH